MLKVTILFLVIAASVSAHTTFTLPTSGCPAAHCSIFAGNQEPLAPPAATPPTQQFKDPVTGHSGGIGCVSNNTFVACTYGAGPLRDGSGVRYCPVGVFGQIRKILW
jgi:hypothetical protein